MMTHAELRQIKFMIDSVAVSLEELKAIIQDPLNKMRLERVLKLAQEEISTSVCPIHGVEPTIYITVDSRTGQFGVKTKSCCELFEKNTTSRLQKSLAQTAYFNPGLRLSLHIKDSGIALTYDVSSITQLEIGRGELEEGVHINLHDCEGERKTVSRRHATILWEKGALHLRDNNSSNGTYLNETPLVPMQLYKLRHGDNIRLGQVIIEVALVKSQV